MSCVKGTQMLRCHFLNISQSFVFSLKWEWHVGIAAVDIVECEF